MLGAPTAGWRRCAEPEPGPGEARADSRPSRSDSEDRLGPTRMDEATRAGRSEGGPGASESPSGLGGRAGGRAAAAAAGRGPGRPCRGPRAGVRGAAPAREACSLAAGPAAAGAGEQRGRGGASRAAADPIGQIRSIPGHLAATRAACSLRLPAVQLRGYPPAGRERPPGSARARRAPRRAPPPPPCAAAAQPRVAADSEPSGPAAPAAARSLSAAP